MTKKHILQISDNNKKRHAWETTVDCNNGYLCERVHNKSFEHESKGVCIEHWTREVVSVGVGRNHKSGDSKQTRPIACVRCWERDQCVVVVQMKVNRVGRH